MADDGLSIDRYKEKRDFSRTPEPAPKTELGADAAGRREFVVQRHEARRLHYDLRLEMEGVLKSWAVPKGFSYVPEDKHLAVRTEDHPIEYLDFDGVIPKGEYGAGTMVIWDRGTYEVVKGKNGVDAIEAGKLELKLYGHRLRGEWHMVKTSGERDWLLFKHRDRYARREGDIAFPLTLEEAPAAPESWRPQVMLPGSDSPPFSDEEWLFEVMFEGLRLLIRVDGEDVVFFDSEGEPVGGELQSLLAPLAADARRVRADRAILDGMLVAQDANARPDARLLQTRLDEASLDDVVYYAFDVLRYDDWDVRGFPQEQRKRAVESLVPAKGMKHMTPTSHVVGQGRDLFGLVRAGGLPGLVAKARSAIYVAGPSESWLRIPSAQALDAEGADTGPVAAPGLPSRVKFSNRDKVYWPDQGYTKGDLLDYYDRMAEYLLPHVRKRPVHLLRYPDGVYGKAFYQKDVTQYLPDWVETVQVSEKDGDAARYVVCNDRDTLLFLVNLGSIDIHPWMSTIDDLDSPTYAVIDLDPPEGMFREALRIARVVGRILRGAGMRPVVKTSGKKGIHIGIPLVEGYSYEQARMFCELVARLTVKELGDIATIERSVSKRGRKVYVDYLQNAREQTVVPPYVVRPVPAATVSTPLEWDELAEEVDPTAHTLMTVPERVHRLGDLYRGVLDDPQDIGEAVNKLAEMM